MKRSRTKLKYYYVENDLDKYPEAWCYIVFSRRGPGKTYSFLDYMRRNKTKFLYMKRTNDDVDLLCSGNKYGFDPSPFAPINRDKGCNIHAEKIRNGLGAFHEMDEEYNPIGEAYGYCLSMNSASKFKGFDFSECDFMCLDEFIPLPGTVVKRTEGETLLDMYMTVARDRQKRGKDPLKLILFANAEDIASPITSTLEVMDDIAEMCARGDNYYYDEERGIMVHHITEIQIQENEKTGIYKAMEGTAWHAKSFGGEFAKNDFSNVTEKTLKHSRPLYKLHYKQHDYYIYFNHNAGGCYYMTYKPAAKTVLQYDLNRENGQKQFFIDRIPQLRQALIADRFKFEKYSMYDLIMNYRKIFGIGK